MKTKSKNLKLYRHFYGYEDPRNIDTTKLAKKIGVSQQKIAGLLRSAKNDPTIAEALILKGEQPPHWFAHPQPRHQQQRSDRSSTARNAQPPLRPTENAISQLDMESLSRIYRSATLNERSTTSNTSKGSKIINLFTGEQVPFTQENPREISPWEKVLETYEQAYQNNAYQEFKDRQEHLRWIRSRTQLPQSQPDPIFHLILMNMMKSYIQQDRVQRAQRTNFPDSPRYTKNNTYHARAPDGSIVKVVELNIGNLISDWNKMMETI